MRDEKIRRVCLFVWMPAVAGLCLASAGCRKHPPTTAADSRPPVVATSGAGAPHEKPSTAPKGLGDDVLSLDLASLNARGYLSDAFFDYQTADLREDARTALARDARWLKKYPSIAVLLEGHCDERGTEAYNLALGDRRANATKEYLVELGVPASRIRTVSYGKERPFCTDDAAGCWQKNRRSHLVVTEK